MADEREISIKAAPAAVAALRARLLKRPGAETVSLYSAYYDTADGLLGANRIAFRVRKGDGDVYIQTIKTAAPADQPFKRGEIEQPLADERPEIGALQAVLAPDQFRAVEQAGLAQRYATIFDRTRAPLSGLDRSGEAFTAELALDVGRIEAGDRILPISELEVELKAGSSAALFEVAKAWVGGGVAGIQVTSKGARAEQALSGAAPSVAYARSFTPDPKASALASFGQMAQDCIDQWTLNLPNLTETGDVEAVHQARVAIRRLRSLLVVFAPIIATDAAAADLAALKRAFLMLGDIRNIDVLAAETLPLLMASGFDPRDGARVQAALARRREALWRAAVERIDGPGHTRMLLGLAGWLEGDLWQAEAEPVQRLWRQRPLGPFAAQRLDRAHRKARKAAKRAEAGAIADWHNLRIDLKKLRYAAEFFGGLYPADAARPYVRALRTLQDDLGRLNDLEVAQATLLASGRAAAAPDRAAFGRVALYAQAYLAGASSGATGALARKWRAFAKIDPFWRED